MEMIKIDWGGRPLDPPLQSKPQNLRSVCRIFLQFLNCWRIEEGWSYLLTCITITGFVHNFYAMGGSPLHPDGLPISLSYLKHFAKILDWRLFEGIGATSFSKSWICYRNHFNKWYIYKELIWNVFFLISERGSVVSKSCAVPNLRKNKYYYWL